MRVSATHATVTAARDRTPRRAPFVSRRCDGCVAERHHCFARSDDDGTMMPACARACVCVIDMIVRSGTTTSRSSTRASRSTRRGGSPSRPRREAIDRDSRVAPSRVAPRANRQSFAFVPSSVSSVQGEADRRPERRPLLLSSLLRPHVSPHIATAQAIASHLARRMCAVGAAAPAARGGPSARARDDDDDDDDADDDDADGGGAAAAAGALVIGGGSGVVLRRAS